MPGKIEVRVPLADDMLAVLNDPTYMWSHALKESSRDSQRLFLAMALLPPPISVDDLQVAHSAQRVSQTESFIDSLRTLEDSFIEIDSGFLGDRWTDFRNPSLQDFSREYLNNHSDWLDTLLEFPEYYESVSGVYQLAMARSPGTYTVNKTGLATTRRVYREGSAKFANINRWVAARHEQLMPKAINLALPDGGSPTYRYHYTNRKKDVCERLKELLEIWIAYGAPSTRASRNPLSSLIDYALRPDKEVGAKIMADLLSARRTAEIIEEFSSPDAMLVLRRNLLDKDIWKFPILSKIDEFLEIDSEESLTAWGEEYISYANDLAHSIPRDPDQDYESYSETIDDLRSTSYLLGIDLDEQILALEVARDEIPPETDEPSDYEKYASANKADSSNDDSLSQLDAIFSGLVE